MNFGAPVRFSQLDLEIFGRASGDRNPLHLSIEYASKTAYGQQVVFGALGCMACFARLRREDGQVKRVVADFHRPMFLQVDYRLEETRSGETLVARLFDGSVPVLTTTVQFWAQGTPTEWVLPSERAVFPTGMARELKWGDLERGMESVGDYQVDPEGFQELYARWFLTLAPAVARVMLWCSYFVGMELPGRNALFFRAALDFDKDAPQNSKLDFRATVMNLNNSLQQVRSAVEVSAEGVSVAKGQLTAFVRPEVPRLKLAGLQQSSGGGLTGRTAVVLGASRGLGAALVAALALEGARVLAVARSEATWRDEISAELAGKVTFVKMDVADSDSMQELAATIKSDFGGLNFLICSAFPAIAPYRLESSAASRIQDYIQTATQMLLSPLCAMLPQLNASRGCVVLISSAAVEQPVRDWPHYVAAKSAVEAICRVAPMQFPETSTLIVRPERLLTEMTNTPMGRQGAASPEMLARQIARSLQQTPAAGTCEWFSAKDLDDELVEQGVMEALAR